MAVPIVTVFGSSSPRTPTPYCILGYELGYALAQRGWILRNGAGADGCMGASTDGALAGGGVVEGVNLRHFVDQGFVHPQLKPDSLRVAETMRERKAWLGQGVSAYVVLPGGPGTWEECWEVVVERQIGRHNKPLILSDVDGFWQGFQLMLERADTDGLLYGPISELLTVCHGLDETLAALSALEI